MTPSPRAARSLDEALGQALEDLEAGLSPLEVLDRYPQYEAELAPLIETAYRMRTARWPVLSMSARVAGRERMHAALAEQKVRRHFYVPALWRQLGAGLALVALAGTTYLASPVSPLRSMSRPRLTPKAPVVATVTWTPTASPTVKVEILGVIETATASPTLGVRRTSEATEAAERLRDVPTSLATATFTPTATRTRRPAARSTSTVTPPPATPVEAGSSGPAATAAPQQPTPTVRHPERPKPVGTSIPEPTTAPTRTPRPPKKPEASPTAQQAEITGMSAPVSATTQGNLGQQMRVLGGVGRSAEQERRDVQQAWRAARSSSGQAGRK